jgi:RNA polymerase sigma factor (sigma-70 family)
MAENQSVYLQACLDRLKAGDNGARKDLLQGAVKRLTELTRVMFRDYQRLKRWEETDDVMQNAMIRLHRALDSVMPASVRDFYRLAGLQIRRELIDLARHYYGPQGLGNKQVTNADATGSNEIQPPLYEQAESADAPSRLAVWSEFHERVDALPEEEREVFDLVWYQGLTHIEAANLLNVSAKTVKRRWQSACVRLHESLRGELPG